MSEIETRLHQVSIYGYDYQAPVPKNLPALVGLVGEEAVYKNALDNLIYRGIGPDVAAKFLALGRALPGVKFHKDAEGKEVSPLPKGQAQINLIRAEYDGSEGDIESVLTRLAIQAAASVDYVAGIRDAAIGGRASGNIGQEWLTIATNIIEGVRAKYAGAPNFERWLETQRQWVPGVQLDDPNGDGWPSVEAVALIVRNVHRAKTKAAAQQDL